MPTQYQKTRLNTMNMLISIIIPVYNVEKYIIGCLQSVTSQDYKGDIECLLVDDCGSDLSMELAKEFIASNKKANITFTILHHQHNRGLSAARNTGIDAATGEYVYFLDSDDSIAPKAIRLMAEPLQKKKYDFVVANYQLTGSKDSAPVLGLKEGEYIGNDKIVNSYHIQWFAMAWNKLVSLDFIKKNHLYFKEGLIREDELWSFKLACVATSMYVIPHSTYNYLLQREDSIMGATKQVKKIKAMVTVMNGWVEIAHAYSNEYSRQHLYYLLEMTKRNTYIESYSCMDWESRKELYKKLRMLRLALPTNISLTKKIMLLMRDMHSNTTIPTNIGFLEMELITRGAVLIRRIKSKRNG